MTNKFELTDDDLNNVTGGAKPEDFDCPKIAPDADCMSCENRFSCFFGNCK